MLEPIGHQMHQDSPAEVFNGIPWTVYALEVSILDTTHRLCSRASTEIPPSALASFMYLDFLLSLLPPYSSTTTLLTPANFALLDL